MSNNKKSETKSETKLDGAPVDATIVASATAAPVTVLTPQPAKAAKPTIGDLIQKTLAISLEDLPMFLRTHKLPLGPVLAARDPLELDAYVAARMDSLRELSIDSTLPADIQKAVMVLVDSAGQVKPGMEEVTTRWRIPRIQIAQATSTTAAKPDSAKNGDLFTTAGKVLEKPFPFIPFHFSQENIMFPMGAKAPSCQAPDAKLGSPFGECQKCPHLPFGMQNGGKGDQKKTECQNQIVVVALSRDLTQVYMIQFSKTSRGAGSALQSLAGQMPVPWQQSYLLETEKGNSELGNFHKYKVAPTGKDNDPNAIRVAQALCDLYSAERYRFLAEHYRGAASAPAMAAAAEGEFQGGKLDAGLAGEVEPYDLGEATAAAGSSASNVRTAAKPL